MKSINYSKVLVSCVCVVLGLAACTKDENIKTSAVRPEKRIAEFSVGAGVYPKIIQLYNDTVYILDVPFTRINGEQLIIEEGTLIKAGVRSVSNPGSNNPTVGGIAIGQGGVLIANGTSDKPIVFTSNMLPGTQGINWEGISIEGRSTENTRTTAADPTDFSVSLRYVRIEFAPLTLRAVGNRSNFDNIMVSYTNRFGVSAYNIYGGTFNARNLISYACSGPADFFISNGYSGRMQNVLTYRHPYFGSTGSTPVNSLSGIFVQNTTGNNVATAMPFTLPVISNLTVIGPDGQNGSPDQYTSTTVRAASFVTTRSTCFNIRNSLLMGFPKAGWILDDANTGNAILANNAAVTYSIFQTKDTSRAFFLPQGVFPPYGSVDFKNYMLSAPFANRLFLSIDQFSLGNIFNYDKPELLPKEGSVVLTGAKFDNAFADPFFNKVEYLGAFGKTDWTVGWANFTPLKTNYNFPE